MTEDEGIRLRPRAGARGAALFIFVAVPSLLLYLAGLPWFYLLLTDDQPGLIMPALALLACALAAPGMLLGTGRWGHWWHLVPLYATPFVFFGLLLVGTALQLPFFFAGAAILSIAVLMGWHRRIDGYYNARYERNSHRATSV